MSWFDFKEYHDPERDDYGLTEENRQEQLEMMREDMEYQDNHPEEFEDY